MDEDLKKKLQELASEVQNRNQQVDNLNKLLSEAQSRNENTDKQISELQANLDKLAVRVNRPNGEAAKPQEKGRLARAMRSIESGKAVIVRSDPVSGEDSGSDSGAGDTPAAESYTPDSTSTQPLLVLPEFMKQIIRQEDATTFVRKLFDWNTATTPDIRGRIGTSIEAKHVGEGDERSKTKGATFTEIKPTWSQIYCNPEVTAELLQDSSYDLESWYIKETGTAFGLLLEEDVMTGSGSNNECLGLFSSGMSTDKDGTRDVTKFQKIACAANAIDFDVLKRLIGSARARYRNGASFLVNHDLYLTLQTLKDEQGRYIWEPSVKAGEPDLLLGYPVYDSEFVPAVASAACPLAFGNFKLALKGYDRPQLRFIRDDITHKGFVSFYTEKRAGVMLQDTAAVKFLAIS